MEESPNRDSRGSASLSSASLSSASVGSGDRQSGGTKRNIAAIVIKLVGLLVGGAGSVLCLASLVGAGTDNFWIGVGVGATVALVVPALIAGKLLPSDVSKRQKGLFGDVYALCWLGFLLLYAVAANGLTRNLLAEQGDRLTAAGNGMLGSVMYALAAVDAVPPATELSPEASASATASAAAGQASAAASASAGH